MVRVAGIESPEDAARHNERVRAGAPASRRDAAAPAPAPPRAVTANTTRSRSNLGKDWELRCIQVHDLYESQGIGYIYQVKNSWIPCPSRRLWEKLPPNKRATTGDGSLIMRARTPCDFMGHYRAHPVGYDAKTSGKETFNIEQFFKEHQCRALLKFKCGRSGATAGFMFEARLASLCYFVDVDAAWGLVNQVRIKHVDIDWMNTHARFIIRPDFRGLYDWGAVMFPHAGVDL